LVGSIMLSSSGDVPEPWDDGQRRHPPWSCDPGPESARHRVPLNVTPSLEAAIGEKTYFLRRLLLRMVAQQPGRGVRHAFAGQAVAYPDLAEPWRRGAEGGTALWGRRNHRPQDHIDLANLRSQDSRVGIATQSEVRRAAVGPEPARLGPRRQLCPVRKAPLDTASSNPASAVTRFFRSVVVARRRVMTLRLALPRRSQLAKDEFHPVEQRAVEARRRPRAQYSSRQGYRDLVLQPANPSTHGPVDAAVATQVALLQRADQVVHRVQLLAGVRISAAAAESR